MRTRRGMGAAAPLGAALTALVPPGAGVRGLPGSAPAVGQCFHLSTDELAAPEYVEPVVDCAVHPSQVVAVAQLPAGLAYEGADKSDALERVASRPANRPCAGGRREGRGRVRAQRLLEDAYSKTTR